MRISIIFLFASFILAVVTDVKAQSSSNDRPSAKKKNPSASIPQRQVPNLLLLQSMCNATKDECNKIALSLGYKLDPAATSQADVYVRWNGDKIFKFQSNAVMYFTDSLLRFEQCLQNIKNGEAGYKYVNQEKNEYCSTKIYSNENYNLHILDCQLKSYKHSISIHSHKNPYYNPDFAQSWIKGQNGNYTFRKSYIQEFKSQKNTQSNDTARKKSFILQEVQREKLNVYNSPKTDRIQKLWNLIQKRKSIDTTLPSWKSFLKTRSYNVTCIEGDCQNGYGIGFAMYEGYPSQVEGNFVNGKFYTNGGFLTDFVVTSIYGHIYAGSPPNTVICCQDGLCHLRRHHNEIDPLQNNSERGFSYDEVMFFQELSFGQFSKQEVLTPTDIESIAEYKSVVAHDPDPTFAGVHQADFKEQTHYEKVKGRVLKNNTKDNVYIRGYRKSQIDKYYSDADGIRKIEYFDISFLIKPNKYAGVNFNTFVPYDNKDSLFRREEEFGHSGKYSFSDKKELEYNNSGYKEYEKYTGSYIKR